jgi:3-oxoadipate enol-lactonase
VPCEVNFELSGAPDAPVVVLAGSLGTDLSMWDPQARALGNRFRVLRYDLRGHGASPIPPGPYGIADLGGDLLALMDRLEIERAALCGMSIGGMTAIWVAAHAPARVERLTLCCTSARFAPEACETYRSRAATVREQGIEPIADSVLARWFTPAFAHANPELMQQMRGVLCSVSPEGYAACCEALAALDLRAELAQIVAPTLVLAGEEDPATPPAHGRVIAEAIHGARMTTVSNAAHLASIERAELVTAVILGFMDPNEKE